MSIRLTDQRYEEIKSVVADTFIKNNIHCVPISGFELATKLGAKVIPYSLFSKETQSLMMRYSEDGFAIKRDGIWYIYYNEKQEYGRINLTLLHECGHIVLDHTEHSELAETEANFFAKYAIAPPVLIYKLRLKNEYEVYEHFDISMQAAEYAFEYYKKWLIFGKSYLTTYERKIINLFDEVG